MTAERGFNPPPPVPPERVAERESKKESKNNAHIPEPAEKPQDEGEEFQPDWSAEDDDEGGVFTVKDELLIEGERKIVERKARFSAHCRSEVRVIDVV